MAFPRVVLTKLDVPPRLALERIMGIASGLGWAKTSSDDVQCFFKLPSSVAGTLGVELQVWFPPDENQLICELRHAGLELQPYCAAVTVAVQVVHGRYGAAFGHNLEPFIEMFPE